MARSRPFNLTAQLNIQGPRNLRPVIANIRRQLGTLNTNLNINIDRNASRNIQNLNNQINTLNSTLTQTATISQQVAANLNTISSAANNVQQNTNRATGGINNAANATNNLNNNLQQARNSMEDFGRQSALAVRRFVAFSAAAAPIYALTSAISNAFSELVKFDKEVVRLQQVTGQSRSTLSGLTDEIGRLSTTLGVSSADLIQVSSTLAQAGLSASQTTTALEALAKASLAPSFDDLTNTVEGSIAAMRQFGIASSQLEGALGSINAVAAAFAVEAGDIIAAIQRTGGVFAAASNGVSQGTDALNEFIAVFTSVRATTRESAETIATGLRTIFTRIQRGSTIDFLRELGIQLTDVEGKFVGPFKAVERLSAALRTLDPRDLRYSQIVEELGGFRQIGKVIPLIQQFATAQQALKVAQEGQGSLAKDAITAQQSLANQFTKVREEFLAFVRSIGESKTFQNITKLVLGLASSLISVGKAFKPILPYLAILGAIRGTQAAVSFGRGFFGGGGGAGGGGQAAPTPTGGPAAPAPTGGATTQQQNVLNNATVVANTNAVTAQTTALGSNTTAIGSLQAAINQMNNTFVNGVNILARVITQRGQGGQTLNKGGKVLAFARGGVVPGSGKGDQVPALLEPGEVVMSNRAVSKYGRGNLVRMNKYAKGGRIARIKNKGARDGDSWYVDYEPAADVVGGVTTRAIDYDAYEVDKGKRWEKALGAIATKVADAEYERSDDLTNTGSFYQGFQTNKVKGKYSIGSRPTHEISSDLKNSLISLGVAKEAKKDNTATGSTEQPTPLQIQTLKDYGYNYNTKTGQTKSLTKKNLGGLIQKFVGGGTVEDIAAAKGISVQQAVLEQLQALGGGAGIKQILGASAGGPLARKALRKNSIEAGRYLKEATDFVNRALKAKGTGDAAEQARISKLSKVAVAGLIPIGYNKDFEWDIGNDTSVYANVRGLSDRYKEAVAQMQMETSSAAGRFAENLQYSDIFGGGENLAFDFDETLVSGADILGPDGKPDIPKYSDRKVVSSALQQGRLTRLGLKVKELVSANPDFIKNTRVLTARPQSTADLLASTLQRLGLPYTESDITGVGQDQGSTGAKKAANLSAVEKLIDDSLENITAVGKAGKRGFLYNEPKPQPALDELIGQGNIEGAVIEKALALLGANLPPIEQLESNRAVDFPNGLGRAAQFFGVDPNIPTEVKRTLNSDSFERARAEFGRYFSENTFAEGGQADPKNTLERYFQDSSFVNLGLTNSKNLNKEQRKSLASDVRNLRRLKTAAPSTLYSSISRVAFDKMAQQIGLNKQPAVPEGTKYLDQEKILANEVAKIKGKSFSLPGFVSTSKNYSIAKSFLDNAPRGEDNWAAMLTIATKKNAQGIDVEQQLSGRNIPLTKQDINPRSGKMETMYVDPPSKEQEVLIQPRSRFRINDVKFAKLGANKNLWANVEQFADGGWIQHFADAGEVRDRSTKNRRRGAYGQRGFVPLNSREYEAFADKAYIDAGPYGGPGWGTVSGVPMPKVLADYAEKINRYVFETGGAGLSIGKKLVKIPDDIDPEALEALKEDLIRQYDGWYSEIEEVLPFGKSINTTTTNPSSLAKQARIEAAMMAEAGNKAYTSAEEAIANFKKTGTLTPFDPAIDSHITSSFPKYINELESSLKSETDPDEKASIQRKLKKAQAGWQDYKGLLSGTPVPNQGRITGLSETLNALLERYGSPVSSNEVDNIIKAMGSKLLRKNSGGFINRFANGGSVPALVSNGEAFIPPKLAQKIGYGNLKKMNQADRNGISKFSSGGISVFKGPGTGTSDSIPTNLPVGSFILRAKATKALGFNRGGAVGSIQRFQDGGGAESRYGAGFIGSGGLDADQSFIPFDMLANQANNLAQAQQQVINTTNQNSDATNQLANNTMKTNRIFAVLNTISPNLAGKFREMSEAMGGWTATAALATTTLSTQLPALYQSLDRLTGTQLSRSGAAAGIAGGLQQGGANLFAGVNASQAAGFGATGTAITGLVSTIGGAISGYLQAKEQKDTENLRRALQESDARMETLFGRLEQGTLAPEKRAELIAELDKEIATADNQLGSALENAGGKFETTLAKLAEATSGVVITFAALKAAVRKSDGGIVYASKGTYVKYQPKGTDTVPAMLSPGEFVVNAKSTRKNLGLLNAINKNKGGFIKPNYLARGGMPSFWEDYTRNLSNFYNPFSAAESEADNDTFGKILKYGGRTAMGIGAVAGTAAAGLGAAGIGAAGTVGSGLSMAGRGVGNLGGMAARSLRGATRGRGVGRLVDIGLLAGSIGSAIPGIMGSSGPSEADIEKNARRAEGLDTKIRRGALEGQEFDTNSILRTLNQAGGMQEGAARDEFLTQSGTSPIVRGAEEAALAGAGIDNSVLVAARKKSEADRTQQEKKAIETADAARQRLFEDAFLKTSQLSDEDKQIALNQAQQAGAKSASEARASGQQLSEEQTKLADAYDKVYGVGKKYIAQQSEQILQTEKNNRLLKESQAAAENFVNAINTIEAGLQRAAAAFGEGMLQIDNSLGVMEGRIPKVSRLTEDIFGNLRAYKPEEIAKASSDLAKSFGFDKISTGTRVTASGVENVNLGDTLKEASLATRALEVDLPRIFRENAGAVGGGDIRKQIQEGLMTGGVSEETAKSIAKEIADKASSQTAGGKAVSFAALAQDVPGFLNSIESLKKANELQAKLIKTINDSLDAYNSKIQEAAERTVEASRIRADSAKVQADFQVSLKQALGKRTTLAEETAGFDAGLRELTTIRGAGGAPVMQGTTDPVALQRRSEAAQQQLNRLSQEQQAAGAAGFGDKNRDAAMKMQTEIIKKSNEALKKLAEDGSRAAAALSKVQELSQVRQARRGGIMKLLSNMDNPEFMMEQGRIMGATQRVKGGNASLQDIQLVAQNFDEITSMMDPAMAQRFTEQFKDLVKNIPGLTDETKKFIEGAFNPQSDPAVQQAIRVAEAFKNQQIEAQKILAANLEEASQKIMDGLPSAAEEFKKIITQAAVEAANELSRQSRERLFQAGGNVPVELAQQLVTPANISTLLKNDAANISGLGFKGAIKGDKPSFDLSMKPKVLKDLIASGSLSGTLEDGTSFADAIGPRFDDVIEALKSRDFTMDIVKLEEAIQNNKVKFDEEQLEILADIGAIQISIQGLEKLDDAKIELDLDDTVQKQLDDLLDGFRKFKAEKPATLARGGVVYANKGRIIGMQPKGTDTVPAMLTPGEFVINKAATARNLPLLKAINSGKSSPAFSKGGVTYAANGGIISDKEASDFITKFSNLSAMFDSGGAFFGDDGYKTLSNPNALRGIVDEYTKAIDEIMSLANSTTSFSDNRILSDNLGNYLQNNFPADLTSLMQLRRILNVNAYKQRIQEVYNKISEASGQIQNLTQPTEAQIKPSIFIEGVTQGTVAPTGLGGQPGEKNAYVLQLKDRKKQFQDMKEQRKQAFMARFPGLFPKKKKLTKEEVRLRNANIASMGMDQRAADDLLQVKKTSENKSKHLAEYISRRNNPDYTQGGMPYSVSDYSIDEGLDDKETDDLYAAWDAKENQRIDTQVASNRETKEKATADALAANERQRQADLAQAEKDRMEREQREIQSRQLSENAANKQIADARRKARERREQEDLAAQQIARQNREQRQIAQQQKAMEEEQARKQEEERVATENRAQARLQILIDKATKQSLSKEEDLELAKLEEKYSVPFMRQQASLGAHQQLERERTRSVFAEGGQEALVARHEQNIQEWNAKLAEAKETLGSPGQMVAGMGYAAFQNYVLGNENITDKEINASWIKWIAGLGLEIGSDPTTFTGAGFIDDVAGAAIRRGASGFSRLFTSPATNATAKARLARQLSSAGIPDNQIFEAFSLLEQTGSPEFIDSLILKAKGLKAFDDIQSSAPKMADSRALAVFAQRDNRLLNAGLQPDNFSMPGNYDRFLDTPQVPIDIQIADVLDAPRTNTRNMDTDGLSPMQRSIIEANAPTTRSTTEVAARAAEAAPTAAAETTARAAEKPVVSFALPTDMQGSIPNASAEQIANEIERRLLEGSNLLDIGKNWDLTGTDDDIISAMNKLRFPENINTQANTEAIARNTTAASQRIIDTVENIGEATPEEIKQVLVAEYMNTGSLDQIAQRTNSTVQNLLDAAGVSNVEDLITGSVEAANPYNRGGIVYRAGGGSIFKPRGTDTVPAMLTPGEFVVNRKATQANLGLLHQINKNSGTRYYQKGGQVSYLAGGGTANGSMGIDFSPFMDGVTEFSIYVNDFTTAVNNIPTWDFSEFTRGITTFSNAITILTGSLGPINTAAAAFGTATQNISQAVAALANIPTTITINGRIDMPTQIVVTVEGNTTGADTTALTKEIINKVALGLSQGNPQINVSSLLNQT